MESLCIYERQALKHDAGVAKEAGLGRFLHQQFAGSGWIKSWNAAFKIAC
jgi:hypothetical protein